MERPVCYDVTRLLTRILNATPNGIDRIDFALASHFLGKDRPGVFGSTATGFGARLMEGRAAREAVAAIGAHWGEVGRAVDSDLPYRRVVAFLQGTPVPPGASRRRHLVLPAKIPAVVKWARRHGIPLRRPQTDLPPHAVYVNSSQFPLWVSRAFEWVDGRSDVRAAFFIHDLLPIQFPEYFRAGEYPRHLARMKNFARFASAAIVTTRTVASDLEAHMASLGRRDVPIFVAPTPLAPIFSTPRMIAPELGGTPYFVFCATLEPRKNHLMILTAWRALVGRLGRDAPKLILVGTRGWHFGPIIDLIERSPGLKDHVFEIGGLSTPALKRLMDNAQAVLMPSFGEGYGLPVHEALAAGTPVIASDISAFREISADGLELLSPLDGEAWIEAIAARSHIARLPQPTQPASTWDAYFAALDRFLEAL